MSTLENYEIQKQKNIDDQLAEANNVIDIQNCWIAALLSCEIPERRYQDCAVCGNAPCIYAYNKLKTLWPELSDWPPQPTDTEIDSENRRREKL